MRGAAAPARRPPPLPSPSSASTSCRCAFLALRWAGGATRLGKRSLLLGKRSLLLGAAGAALLMLGCMLGGAAGGGSSSSCLVASASKGRRRAAQATCSQCRRPNSLALMRSVSSEPDGGGAALPSARFTAHHWIAASRQHRALA